MTPVAFPHPPSSPTAEQGMVAAMLAANGTVPSGSGNNVHVHTNTALSGRTVACIIIGIVIFACAVYALYTLSQRNVVCASGEAIRRSTNRASINKASIQRSRNSHVNLTVATASFKGTISPSSRHLPHDLSLWGKCLAYLGIGDTKRPQQSTPHITPKPGKSVGWTRAGLASTPKNVHSSVGHIRNATAGPSRCDRRDAKTYIVGAGISPRTEAVNVSTTPIVRGNLRTARSLVPMTAMVTMHKGKEDKLTLNDAESLSTLAGPLDCGKFDGISSL